MRDGMNLCKEPCKRVKEDRQNDDGAFWKVHREHRACLSRKKRKRRNADGAGQQQLAMCDDDIEQLWTAAAAFSSNSKTVFAPQDIVLTCLF
jgi:hypothetical protein